MLRSDPTPAPPAINDDELDEAFLERVDRAMHERKVSDPWRLDQMHRAMTEELHHNRFHGLS